MYISYTHRLQLFVRVTFTSRLQNLLSLFVWLKYQFSNFLEMSALTKSNFGRVVDCYFSSVPVFKYKEPFGSKVPD